MLNIKNTVQNGGLSTKSNNNNDNHKNIFSDIQDAYKSEFYNIDLQNFKDNVTSKYFKDKIIGCLRKHASDIDNIESLREAICNKNNSIYNIIKNFYKLPNNINDIKQLLFFITIAMYAIFSINFVMIILYLMKDTNYIVLLILFLLLTFILFLILFVV